MFSEQFFSANSPKDAVQINPRESRILSLKSKSLQDLLKAALPSHISLFSIIFFPLLQCVYPFTHFSVVLSAFLGSAAAPQLSLKF